MTERRLHQGQPVYAYGAPLQEATAAMVMLHGRGATAQDILLLAREWQAPGWAFIAPQAANSTWYPYRFMEPLDHNEPWLASALELLDQLVARVSGELPFAQLMLLGFSQGACLAVEYAARHARRYGGVVGLSGGLIGPDDTPRNYPGSFDRTPVFLGCSDVDFHIPKERVMETAQVFEKMRAHVTMRLYPKMEHTVNEDEIAVVQGMLERLKMRD